MVEVLVGAALAGTLLIAVISAFATYENVQSRQVFSIKGQLLAEEGLEVLRLIRNTGWNNLANIPAGSTRYIYFSGSSWSVTTTPDIIDGVFYRSFSTASTSRDENSNIVSSEGVNDPNTLLAIFSVSWSVHNATSSVSYSDYLMNY